MYGDGDDRPILEKYCSDHGVNNVVFKGQVQKRYIPYILSKCNLSVLNYKKAKRIAKKNYNIKCDSIALGYGYNNPVYEIRGSNKLILLDYDSFERVYEREIR